MPTQQYAKTYEFEGELRESDLDFMKDEIETAFNVTKFDDANIQDDGITASEKIALASIVTSRIAADAATAAKVIDGSVSTEKFQDSAITTAKIAATAITYPKLGAANYTFSSDIATGNLTSSSDQTLATVTIVPNGRPVRIVLVPHSTAVASSFLATAGIRLQNIGTSENASLDFTLKRDSTYIGNVKVGGAIVAASNSTTFDLPSTLVSFIDNAAPLTGTRTYTLYVRRDDSMGDFYSVRGRILAYEL